MSRRRIVVAGTASGVGKTTVTIGLMAALKKKGLTVQGFKCGPDYIDPSYHSAVTNRVSRNLDSWMFDEETVLDIFQHGSTSADIAVIEGVMGLFDGKDPRTNQGSTAEISVLINSPVLLIVDCASMARSAAAIVKGFQTFSEEVKIIGVIANKVGSEGHFQLVKTAIEQECHIPVIGYMQRETGIEIPERQLGLIPSIERGELDTFFDTLGELVLKTVDIDKLLELSEAESLQVNRKSSLFNKKKDPSVNIAVAKDAAFYSYYEENLEILESYGAELFYFSPLANEPLPDNIDGIYMGGSLPEEFITTLSKNDSSKVSIKKAIESGVPTLAECGGFMYLTNMIETTNNTSYPMVGLIPGKIKNEQTLQAIGYREITGSPGNFLMNENETARGHEFHYSTFHPEKDVPYAYETKGMRGTKKDGYLTKNLVAGFTQFHFASNPDLVKNWLTFCEEYGGKTNEKR